METTLHQQLKRLYAVHESDCEVTVDGYRIDAVSEDQLFEIQCASLSAIRDKVRRLVQSHDVVVAKPLFARKLIVKRSRKGGRFESKRYSPVRQTFHDIADDLVHFVSVFPHARLTLEVLLVEVEETRLPPLRRRRTRKPYRVQDRQLLSVGDRLLLRTAADLRVLLPDNLPDLFTTADIASCANIPRWKAQKLSYCLRKTGAVVTDGKAGNNILYRIPTVEQKAA